MKKSTKLIGASALFAGFLSVAAPVLASPVSFAFSGVIDAVDDPLGGGFSVGATFSFTGTYDSTAPAISAGADKNLYIGGPTQALVDTYVASSSLLGVSVFDGVVRGRNRVDFETNRADADLVGASFDGATIVIPGPPPPPPPALELTAISLALDPNSMSFLSDTSAPTSFGLADFDGPLTGLGLEFSDGGPLPVGLLTNVTSLTTVTLPDGNLQITVTGVVTDVDPKLAGEFSLGESMTYTVEYDPTVAPEGFGLPNRATYRSPSLTATIGDYDVSADGVFVTVFDRMAGDLDNDRIDIELDRAAADAVGLTFTAALVPDATAPPPLPTDLEFRLSSFGVGLYEPVGVDLSSDTSLPIDIDLSRYVLPTSFGLLFETFAPGNPHDGEIIGVAGRIQSAVFNRQTANVPAPATILLVGFGLAALRRWAWWRS